MNRAACGGAVRIIACFEDAEVIEQILTHLDTKAVEPEAPRRPPCRAPPQREPGAKGGKAAGPLTLGRREILQFSTD